MKNIVLIFISCLFLNACMTTQLTTYQQLGGQPKVAEIVDNFISEIQLADQNTVNPRHTATAALVDTVAPIKSAGGFASLKAHDTVLIILPPREFMSRSGNEVNVDDLDACQFTKAVVVGK